MKTEQQFLVYEKTVIKGREFIYPVTFTPADRDRAESEAAKFQPTQFRSRYADLYKV